MIQKQEKHRAIWVISNSEGARPEFAYPVPNIHTKLPALSLYSKNLLKLCGMRITFRKKQSAHVCAISRKTGK